MYVRMYVCFIYVRPNQIIIYLYINMMHLLILHQCKTNGRHALFNKKAIKLIV